MYALSLLSFILLVDCTAQGEKEKKWTETLKIIRAGVRKPMALTHFFIHFIY